MECGQAWAVQGWVTSSLEGCQSGEELKQAVMRMPGFGWIADIFGPWGGGGC